LESCPYKKKLEGGKMHIYMTGGTGFIGSFILKELSRCRHKITVLARNPRKVPALSKLPGVEIKQFDLSGAGSLEKMAKKMDALVLVALGWGDTGPDMIKNETIPEITMIDIAVRKGAKKIIFTSSTAAAGPIEKTTGEEGRRRPADFYGATKGTVELFMSAYSNYHKNTAFNVIRPGYTFGNPVVPGASMEPDTRFRDICKKAKKGAGLEFIKNDGTQFLWAGGLAKLYSAVLAGSCKNEIFYGLSKNFITWEQIGKWALEYAGVKTKIKLRGLGWSNTPPLYSVDKIKKYFGLSFDSTEKVKEHVKYLIENS
jgi:UDP-glucose 4-epimerase